MSNSLDDVLHHIVLEVSSLRRASEFYDALLSPLGWRRHFNEADAIGYGISKPVLYITERAGTRAEGTLISVSTPGIAAVKAAWEAGCARGGSNIASPGDVVGHGSGTYSAFLRDPDGHEVEITVASD